MRNLKESREYFKPRLQLELTNLRDVFDQEFKDVLTEIDYKSISDKGRRRPITFMRTLFTELVHEIYPIFGREAFNGNSILADNTKLLDQQIVATVIGIDRSSLTHHHKNYEFDKKFFKPLVDVMDNEIRPKSIEIRTRIKSMIDAYEGERRKAIKNGLKRARKKSIKY